MSVNSLAPCLVAELRAGYMGALRFQAGRRSPCPVTRWVIINDRGNCPFLRLRSQDESRFRKCHWPARSTELPKML